MAAVTNSTILTATADFLVQRLRANLTTDPAGSRPSNSSFIGFKHNAKVLHYPVITVGIANVQASPALGAGTEAHEYTITAEVEIWVKKSVYDADNLTQQVIDAIRKEHYGTSSAVANNLYEPIITSVIPIAHEQDFGSGGWETIHRRVVTVRYKYVTDGL